MVEQGLLNTPELYLKSSRCCALGLGQTRNKPVLTSSEILDQLSLCLNSGDLSVPESSKLKLKISRMCYLEPMQIFIHNFKPKL